MPKVSVIIPCYNSQNTIRETVESVLVQTMQDFELIVVDDGSTDDTKQIVEYFGHRIRYFYQENSGKSSITRNAGIRAATGEYVAFLDADDLWLPNKLEKQLHAMQDNQMEWCYCDCLFFRDSDHRELGRYSRLYFPGKQGWIGTAQLLGNRVCSPTPIIHKKLLDKAGLFDEALSSREDWDLWLRISMQAPVVYLPDVLAKYRVHAGSKTYAMDPFISYQNHLMVIEKNTRLYSQELMPLRQKAIAFYAARFSKSFWLDGKIHDAKTLLNQAIIIEPYNLKYRVLQLIYSFPHRLANSLLILREWLKNL